MTGKPLVFKPPTDSSGSSGASRSGAPPWTDSGDTEPRKSAEIIDLELAGRDGLDAFSPEHDISVQSAAGVASRKPLAALLGAGVVLMIGIMAITYAAFFRRAAPATAVETATAVATGQASFDSRPSGAEVVIDGVVRGTTPLKLPLPVGTHTLEMRDASGSRSLPLTIEPGVLVSQYVELGAATSATGRLDISSDPAGAEVRLDGVLKGVTPLTLDAIEAREHNVALTRSGTTIYRAVKVTAGATASVMASMGASAAGAVGGYLSLVTPFEVQVMEGGRLLGTSNTDRLMIPAGRHQLTLVNAALQFESVINVNVEPGRVTSPAIAVPEGTVSVNALPWAEVFLDGRSVGTTPLANLSIPIGTHEVVWRHPQLGERRQNVTVTAQAPIRVGVNFTQ